MFLALQHGTKWRAACWRRLVSDVFMIGSQRLFVEEFHSLNLVHGAIRLYAFSILADDTIVLCDYGCARNNPKSKCVHFLLYSCKMCVDCSEMINERLYKSVDVFSPRAVHEQRVICYADDLESWIYCLLAIWSQRVLPWNQRTRAS